MPPPIYSPVIRKPSELTDSLSCLRRSSRRKANVFLEDTESEFDEIGERKSMRRCRDKGDSLSRKPALFSVNVEFNENCLSGEGNLAEVPIVLGNVGSKKVREVEMERFSSEELIEVPIVLGNVGSESNLVEVPIVLGDQKTLEKMRNGFDIVKNKNGSESGLTDLANPCDEIRSLSSSEVYCEEAKFRIESFDMLPVESAFPVESPVDDRDTNVCFEAEMDEEGENVCEFVGEPVLEEEALRRWGWRYELKNKKMKGQCSKLNAGEEDEIILNVKCHYTQARINNCIINLGDCALIKGDGREGHVGKILEFFKTTEDDGYFRVQWFYRAEDTVLQNQASSHDKKRIFYSTVMNDNILDCIVSKVSVTEVTPTLRARSRFSPSNFYYDMEYCVEYSTFRNLPRDDFASSCDLFAPGVSEALQAIISSTPSEKMPSCEPYKDELSLLDLYSGCGGMSTGLCLESSCFALHQYLRDGQSMRTKLHAIA